MATWKWVDDRLGISDLLGPSLTHLVPHDATWWYVFGSATMLAFIVQVVSGVALAFSFTIDIVWLAGERRRAAASDCSDRAFRRR